MIFKASLALMSNWVFNSKRKLAFLFSQKTACLLAFRTFVAAFFKVMSGSPDGFQWRRDSIVSLRQHRYFDLLWRRKSPALNVSRESPRFIQIGFFDFLISILLWENAICKVIFLTEKQVAKEIAWLRNTMMKLKMADNCNFCLFTLDLSIKTMIIVYSCLLP